MMRVITPAPREEWRAVVAGDVRALPEHAPEWVDAICAGGRYADVSRLYVLDDGRSFVLPLVARRGLLGLGGWWQGYPPAWGIGGLVGADADATVVAAVLADLRATGRLRIGLRPDPARWSDWQAALNGTADGPGGVEGGGAAGGAAGSAGGAAGSAGGAAGSGGRNFHPRMENACPWGRDDPEYSSVDGNCGPGMPQTAPPGPGMPQTAPPGPGNAQAARPAATRPNVAATRRAVLTIPRRAHVIDLTGGVDQAFRQLSKSARRGTRVAERAGVRVEIDRTGALLEDYQRLHRLSVDRWAARQHEPRALARWRDSRRDPIAKLEAMAEQLGKAFVVTVAYVDDRPAFASITLLGQTAHDTRAAMDRELVEGTYAGDLVQWRLIELACELGCTAYHLGESGQSTSLSQFKEKFGARPLDYAEVRLERLPVTRLDQQLRSAVKRVLRFRDV